MPKLGEFIGALLADAAQARVRADLEAIRIAQAYSGHELLKHLPVPRFRLPDITVDVPLLVSSVEGIGGESGGRLYDQPSATEITRAVREGLNASAVRLPRTEVTKISRAAADKAAELFAAGPQVLLNQLKVSSELAGIVVRSVKAVLGADLPDDRLQVLETATRTSLTALLTSKLLRSPYLEVIVTASEIKSHGDNESVVHVRLTISEDSYEVVQRDDGSGYYLTPE
jgi:hypothetical protein